MSWPTALYKLTLPLKDMPKSSVTLFCAGLGYILMPSETSKAVISVHGDTINVSVLLPTHPAVAPDTVYVTVLVGLTTAGLVVVPPGLNV